MIGYLDVERGPWQADDARLTVHGRYAARDLPALLRHYRVGIVLFPSAGPETFSYTLSEAWRAGIPALVPPIGALAERVAASGAGWVLSDDEWADEARMLARILSLSRPASADVRARAAASARAVEHVVAAENGRCDARRSTTRPLAGKTVAANAQPDSRTCAFATHWVIGRGHRRRTFTQPPTRRSSVREPPVAAPPAGWMDRVARQALAIRRTPMGRALYRMTPASWIDALKARLDG